MSSTFGWSDASASQASQAWSDDASAVSLSRASEASSGGSSSAGSSQQLVLAVEQALRRTSLASNVDDEREALIVALLAQLACAYGVSREDYEAQIAALARRGVVRANVELPPFACALPEAFQRPTKLLESPEATRYEREFEDLGPLGRGAFGRVRRARHRVDRAVYAVKRVPAPRGGAAAEKYEREMRHLAQLEHPAVIRYFASWVDDRPGGFDAFGGGSSAGSAASEAPERELFLQMELCGERTLRDWIDDRCDAGAARADAALRVIGAVAAGLDHVHSRDVIHRDLKPENLLLREASVEEASDAPPDVVIADFGLSKEVGQVSGEDSPLARNHTTGVGTASYAAPEQLAKGAAYGAPADVFSLGLVLFELATPLGTAMERAKAFQALRSRDPAPALRDAPPAVAALVRRCCALRPADRPTAAEVAAAAAAAVAVAPRDAAADALADLPKRALVEEILRLRRALEGARRDDPGALRGPGDEGAPLARREANPRRGFSA